MEETQIIETVNTVDVEQLQETVEILTNKVTTLQTQLDGYNFPQVLFDTSEHLINLNANYLDKFLNIAIFIGGAFIAAAGWNWWRNSIARREIKKSIEESNKLKEEIKNQQKEIERQEISNLLDFSRMIELLMITISKLPFDTKEAYNLLMNLYLNYFGKYFGSEIVFYSTHKETGVESLNEIVKQLETHLEDFKQKTPSIQKIIIDSFEYQILLLLNHEEKPFESYRERLLNIIETLKSFQPHES